MPPSHLRPFLSSSFLRSSRQKECEAISFWNQEEATCSSRGSDANFKKKKKTKQSDSPQKAFCSRRTELFERYAATSYGDLELFLSLFVLSVTPLGCRVSPGPHSDRHATPNPTPLLRRLLALSPTEPANDRCCHRHRGPLLSGGGKPYLVHTKGGGSEMQILDPGGPGGGGSVASVFCQTLHSKTHLVS